MKKFSVLLGLLAGIAVALQVPNKGAAEAVAMSMVDADCIYCSDRICEPGQHDAWDPPVEDEGEGQGEGQGEDEGDDDYLKYTRNGGVHLSQPCFPLSCAVKHGPSCGRGEEETFAMVDMDRLRGSIEAKDVQTVKDLLASHTQSTALHLERSAVQVIDCVGAVIAHFPVSQDLLDRVSAE